jgi:outer membrane biosynthesis protein TonB
VELASAPDGESVSYSLTVISSAEVLTAAKPESAPVPAATPMPSGAPTPAPKPVQAQVPVLEPVQTGTPAPVSAPALPTPAVASVPVPRSATLVAGFVPPRPILQIPIEPTHDRIYSVMGDVAINLLLDVGEDGAVTKAVLTGHITKDVLKLESAAIDAVSHWRFEPARQDGRIVPAVKIAVQMHFRGRPWRY